MSAEAERLVEDVRQEVQAQTIEWVADAIEARAAEVYPEDIFVKPTKEQYAEINALLKRERGHQLDGVAADAMRRVHAAIVAELREGTLDRYHP